jgi:serine protease Do
MRPYLGIKSFLLSKAKAKNLNLTKFDGIYISAIDFQSPAATAGLMTGDVITKIQGDDVIADMPFLYSLYGFKPGEKLNMLVYRGDEYVKIEVTLVTGSILPQAK